MTNSNLSGKPGLVHNVINGGAGDDLIVLSTDSIATIPTPFTDGGNNALINGASNETIVLTGSNFGNDTVMNFEAGDVSTVPVTPQQFDVTFSGTVAPSASGAVATEVTVGLTLDGTLVTAVYSFSTAQTAAQVATGVVGAINDAVGYTVASVVGGTTIQVLSADLAGAPTISVDDVDALGISVQNFPTSSFGIGPVDGTPVDVVVGSGIDFLDFTAYLTSQFNDSAAPGADSNELIDVTLDNPAGDDTAPTDVVRANEVVLVDLNSTTTAGETFATITAADVAALFNTTTDNFGDLTAAGFNADDTYTKTGNTPSLVGNATAILGVENEANDGEYKFFLLTWDGETDDAPVSASLLGSMDFGDSLDSLAEVNLVASGDYNDLIDQGFYNFLA